MVIGTALGWSNGPTVALAVVLTFAFGYALTLLRLPFGGTILRTSLSNEQEAQLKAALQGLSDDERRAAE